MFYKHENGGVTIYKSTLLTVPHGFSTRLGGVSAEPHLSSMNLGFGMEDGVEAVRENRRRFALACGIREGDIIPNGFTSAAEQLHSDRIEYITGENKAGAFFCDGFYTDAEGVAVAVRTADCVPILFSTKNGDRVAAVHAGWRGTAAGIGALAVEALVTLGADVNDIVAAVGPSVSPDAYRVGDDFGALLRKAMEGSRSTVVRAHARELSEKYLIPYPDGLHCNLWGLNRRILVLAGLCPENVDVSEICTYENGEEFYSHRRQGAKRGVMASLISPKVRFSQ